jgi:hypothetical protein
MYNPQFVIYLTIHKLYWDIVITVKYISPANQGLLQTKNKTTALTHHEIGTYSCILPGIHSHLPLLK